MTVADTSVRSASTEVDAREEHWRRIRRRATVAYCVILVAFVGLVGVPTDREGLLIWIFGAFGIRSLGRGWQDMRRAVLDWLPFTLVLILYDFTRGVADTLGMPVHVEAPADADRWMFGGELPTVWLQEHFFVAGDTRWYDAVVTLIYTSHFLFTPLLAAWLWIRNRQQFIAWINRVVGLAVIGLAGYIFYPAAPPWYAAREGVIEPVVRTTSRGWSEIGLNHAGQVLSKGQAAVNAVAAMPSLHVAYATLVVLFLFRRVRWWWKVPLALYPFAMPLILVYAGEHYVVDAVFGWLAAVIVMVGVALAERWWRRYRAVRAASGALLTDPAGGDREVAAPAEAASPTGVVSGPGERWREETDHPPSERITGERVAGESESAAP